MIKDNKEGDRCDFVTVIVPAAGMGTRMGGHTAKQFIEVFDHPILYYTLWAFQLSPLVDEIILVVGQEDVDWVQQLYVQQYGCTKINAVVSGGDTRLLSVYEGLRHVDTKTTVVMVHDGARPLVHEAIIKRVYEGVITYGACVAGVPAKDTVKIVDGQGKIVENPSRETVYQMQTPQGFSLTLLQKAYEAYFKGTDSGKTMGVITDDAMLVSEFTKQSVYVVLGDYENIKITTQEDLLWMEQVLAKKLRKDP